MSWGSLNWLPDLDRWAQTAATLLTPGGFLYLIEEHPSFSTMGEKDGVLTPTSGWKTPAHSPDVFELSTTYSGDSSPLASSRIYEWRHPLSEIVTALMKWGLAIEFFHEHDVLPWRKLPMMVSSEDRLFRLPNHLPPAPLAFSLRAVKQGQGR